MNDLILEQLANKLYEIGKEMGFSKPVIRSSRYSSEIYIIKEHALQLEIDWRENELFMYVVRLKDRTLPDRNVIYSYEDGQWCRKYLEEIYKTKRPRIKDRNKRYSAEYLLDRFAFYEQLINGAPQILTEFYKSIGTGEQQT